MFKRSFLPWLVILCVLVPINVYGEESIEVVEENVEITEKKDNVEEENIEAVEEDSVIDNNTPLLYDKALEGIISTIFERESFLYPLIYTEDIFDKYVDEDKLGTEINRNDFIQLYVNIENDLTYLYKTETNLDIHGIFSDVEGFSEEELKGINQVYRYNIMHGDCHKLNPNSIMTEGQLEIVLDRIMHIEDIDLGNQPYFDKIKFLFDEPVCEKLLESYDLDVDSISSFLLIEDVNSIFNNKLGIICNYCLSDYLDYREFLHIINSYFSNKLFYYDEELDKFIYYLEDNDIISKEFVGYCNSKLDSYVPVGEIVYIKDKLDTNLEILENLTDLPDYEMTLEVSQGFLRNEYSLINENKECIEYFSKFNMSYSNGSTMLSLALHESQHEASAKKSGCFKDRAFRGNMSGVIYWSRRPSTYYYYNFLQNEWFSLKNTTVPMSYSTYNKLSQGLKNSSSLFKFYAASDMELSNLYGIYGLLQEYTSYTLELHYNYQLYSYGYISKAHLKTALRSAVVMETLVVEYLKNYMTINKEDCEELLMNADLIFYINQNTKFINNIIENTSVSNGMVTGELANWWTENIGGSNSSKNLEEI